MTAWPPSLRPGTGFAGGGLTELEWTTIQESGIVKGGGSQITQSGASFGASTNNKRVFVFWGGAYPSGSQITSATIDGNSAIFTQQHYSAAAYGDVRAAVITADVGTATSGDIVINFAGTGTDGAISWGVLEGSRSTTWDDTFADTTLTSGTAALSDTLVVQNGGIVLGTCCTATNGNNQCPTFDSPFETLTTYIDGNDFTRRWSYVAPPVAGSASYSVTATTNQGWENVMCGMSWR